MNRKSILNCLDINKKDWVLEIGGGPTPFERADIVVDKFLSDNTERSGNLALDRQTVISDAHDLPFMDNSFDYVFCSQLLEHLERPELFFKEIARVGKRGYIETPNEIRERLFGWPFHKWIIDQDAKGLVLRKNDVDQAFGLFFHKLQLENYEFSKFCSASHDLLNICYEWKDMPSYRYAVENEYKLPMDKLYIDAGGVAGIVLSKPHEQKLSEQFGFLRWIKKRCPTKFKKSLKWAIRSLPYGHRHSDKETKAYLAGILVCPTCREKLNFRKEKMLCLKCGRNYHVEDNLVIMLPERKR